MANGVPPDIDEAFKELLNKITRRSKPSQNQTNSTNTDPPQDNTYDDNDSPENQKRRYWIYFFLIAAAILIFFRNHLFSFLSRFSQNDNSSIVEISENSPVSDPVSNPVSNSVSDPVNNPVSGPVSNQAIDSVSSSKDDVALTTHSIFTQISDFFGGINMFESMSFAFLIGTVILLILFLRAFVRIVPQNEAYVVERLGKYDRTLLAGFNLTIPVIEKVAYKHSLKEYAVDVASQSAITQDNVVLNIDGVLYLKIMDARAASYGVENLQFAITQLAQTSMRAEIGRISLDQTFESREVINAQVTRAIDEASESWGTKVLR